MASLTAIIMMAGATGSAAYEEPRTALVQFDPAGIVLDLPMADRLPVLLIGLATDYPQAEDRQRAAALAVTMALHPDSMAAQAANRDLATSTQPDGMGLAMSLPEAVAELRDLGLQVHAEALTDDEKKLGLYLMAVALLFAPEDDALLGASPPLTREGGAKLWRNVLPGP